MHRCAPAGGHYSVGHCTLDIHWAFLSPIIEPSNALLKLLAILDYDTGLTNRDIAIILTSLTKIRATFDLLNMSPR